MGIEVTARIDIRRRCDEVAAYVCDPNNDTTWIRALIKVEVTEPGEVAVGTRVRRDARMMGRTMAYETRVTAIEPGKRLSMESVDGPFQMLVDYEFEDHGGGTRVSVRNRGGEGLMFRIAGPLIGWLMNSRVKGDLKQLKAVLEDRKPPS